MVDSASGAGKKNFCDKKLTRDLFAVANFVLIFNSKISYAARPALSTPLRDGHTHAHSQQL